MVFSVQMFRDAPYRPVNAQSFADHGLLTFYSAGIRSGFCYAVSDYEIAESIVRQQVQVGQSETGNNTIANHLDFCSAGTTFL